MPELIDNNLEHFIDTHAHIYLKDFDKDRQDILRKAVDKRVSRVYMPNLDHTSIDAMLETEEKFPQVCIPMMGLHPTYVKKGFERELYVVEDWLKKKKFAAVGEVGIDLYWDVTFKNEQEEALRIQIDLASQYKLPLIIHCRNSMQETIEVLKNTGKSVSGIFHCFSGTIEQAREVISMGFYLGIGGVITFKNGGLDKIVPELELKNLVLETDSPYLTPAPFRKERNDPTYIPLIAEKLAALKGNSIQDVAKVTSENAINIFSI